MLANKKEYLKEKQLKHKIEETSHFLTNQCDEHQWQKNRLFDSVIWLNQEEKEAAIEKTSQLEKLISQEGEKLADRFEKKTKFFTNAGKVSDIIYYSDKVE